MFLFTIYLTIQIYVYDFDDDGQPLRYPNNILPEYLIRIQVIDYRLH